MASAQIWRRNSFGNDENNVKVSKRAMVAQGGAVQAVECNLANSPKGSGHTHTNIIGTVDTRGVERGKDEPT